MNPLKAGYVLTRSQQFLLMENITQSLAGRIATFNLYPFTANEIYSEKRANSIVDVLMPDPSIEFKIPSTFGGKC